MNWKLNQVLEGNIGEKNVVDLVPCFEGIGLRN